MTHSSILPILRPSRGAGGQNRCGEEAQLYRSSLLQPYAAGTKNRKLYSSSFSTPPRGQSMLWLVGIRLGPASTKRLLGYVYNVSSRIPPLWSKRRHSAGIFCQKRTFWRNVPLEQCQFARICQNSLPDYSARIVCEQFLPERSVVSLAAYTAKRVAKKHIKKPRVSFLTKIQ